MIPLENFEHWTEWAARLGALIFMYPEIHYVFKYLPFSRYCIDEPEILTDAPYRVDPGKRLPVMLLIKDADRYPVRLHSITIGTSGGNQTVFSIEEDISTAWWHKIFYLDVPETLRGSTVEIRSDMDVQINGREKRIANDNFPGLSHGPLKVYCAHEKLPALPGWVCGDLHFHTNYTSDQVEFGAPLAAAVEAAKSLGLDFFAATDHSYDLDDCANDYLNNDPQTRKWLAFKEEVALQNSMPGNNVAVLPGEEVTCSNAEGRNVHCLVIDHPEFIPGSGDGAERWFQTDTEFSVEAIAHKIGGASVALAAHPQDPAPLFESIFIRRGRWETADCRVKNLTGLQILNGLDNAAFREGLARWTEQLLEGARVFIFAGNDAHGNFNRFRQVRIPMLKLHERENHQRFGWAKTCVQIGDHPPSVDRIVRSLKNGRAVITTGPFVTLGVLNGSDRRFEIGDTASGGGFRVAISGITSQEMGAWKEIRMICGERFKRESVVRTFTEFAHPFVLEEQFPFKGASYVRCEAVTTKDLFCYTNPIWFTHA